MPNAFYLDSRRPIRHVLALLSLLALISPCWGKVIYVNGNASGATHDGTSWGTALLTVQEGINTATSGDEVWVATGTYAESITLKAGTSLYGGFAGIETSRVQRNVLAYPTTLHATKDGGSVVTAPSGSGHNTVLDGFTITGGTGTNRGSTNSPWRCGGGVICLGASPTISNCIITGNTAQGDIRSCGTHYYCPSGAGSGAGVFLEQSDARILNNTISSNSAWNEGGAIHLSGGTPQVCGNVISDNTCDRGAGLICKNSAAYVQGNAFLRNTARISGGGLYITGGYVTVVDNEVASNVSKVTASEGVYPADSGQGSGIWCDSGTIYRCALHDNISSNSGSAIWLTGMASVSNSTVVGSEVALATAGAVTVTNCTITSNRTGISVLAGGQPLVANCIVAYNQTGINRDPAAAVPVLSHNNIYGCYKANWVNIPNSTGTNGNISQEPRLSSLYHDIHLEPDSPCVDAGDDSLVRPAETDAYGKRRTIGAHVDIGSDESDGTAWKVPARILHVVRGGSNGSDGLTWDTAKGTVAAALSAAQGGDEVWVARGTYHESVTIPAGVSLYGGFLGNETAREQRDGTANVTSVVSDAYTWTATVSHVGAVIDSLNLVGKGIGVDAEEGIATISHCSILGGEITINGTATVSGCALYGGNGIAVSGNAVIEACSIDGATEQGVNVGSSASASLANCVVSRSKVGVVQYSALSPIKITNCTIAGNTRSGIYCSAAEITNCIIAGNGTDVQRYTAGGTITFNHNDILVNQVDDSINISHDISAIPCYAAEFSGDYRLQSMSPCIDAGDNSVVQLSERDLDGKPRIIGAHVDMGAYEYGTVYYTIADAAMALRLAAGLEAAQSDISWWNRSVSAGIDLLDAIRIARMVVGFDPNP